MKRVKRIVIISIIIVTMFILVGCSKSSKIHNKEIESVNVEILSSSVDSKEVFRLIPIYIYNGKSGYSQYIPYWENIKNVSLKYKYKNNTYNLNTKDFKLVETEGKRYAKIDKSDIGKKDASVVIYTKWHLTQLNCNGLERNIVADKLDRVIADLEELKGELVAYFNLKEVEKWNKF